MAEFTTPAVTMGAVFEDNTDFQPGYTPDRPLRKVDSPLSLNFDELYDAGYSNYAIAKAVGAEFGKDLDGFVKQGGNVNDFLYTYTDIAEPGSIGAFTDRLFRSLTKSTPTTAGIIGGAKLGARVPVAQPLPTLGGMAFGGFLGSQVGEGAVSVGEELGVFDTRPPFRGDRFFAITGDVIGESLPFVFGTPYMMTSSGSTAGALVSERLGKLPGIFRLPGKGYAAVEDMLRGAAQTARGEKGAAAKRLLYGVETTAVGTSALGGATGEFLAGDAGQLTGEIVGGMFEPRVLFARQIPNLLSKITPRFGTDARESALGGKLRAFMTKYGEDPEAVIRELEVAAKTDPMRLKGFMDELGVELELPPLTPDQITGSPVLSMLRQTVAKRGKDSTIDVEAAARAERGFEFIEQVIQVLRAEGDPASVKAAAEIQSEAIEQIITLNLQDANANALSVAAALGKNDDFDIISLNLKTNFDQIVANANAQEKRLWDEIPTDMEVGFDNTLEAIPMIREDFFLETENFPPNISGQIALLRGRLGLDAEEPAEVVDAAVSSAQKALDNLPPTVRKDYDDVLETVLNPESGRLFRQGPEVSPEDSVDPDFLLQRPVRVLDAIRARRKKLGNAITPGENARLKNAERAANAELKLIKATQNQPLAPIPDDPEPIFVKDLVKLRSRALEASRIAMKDGRNQEAKALGQLANSILADLDAVAEGNTAYDTARAFSRGKNDALRRAFLGDTMQRDKNGADIYEPTLLHLSLFEGGADPTAMRFREIFDSSEFVQKELDRLEVDSTLRIPLDDVEFGPVNQDSLRTALAKAVQYTAAKVLDPQTGRINPAEAAAFLQNNEMLLRNFPQIKDMLDDGRAFEDVVKLYDKQRDEFVRINKSNSVLAKILRDENPSTAISSALGSTRPATSLETVIRTVKTATKGANRADLEAKGFDPDAAIDGVRSLMLEWMWTKGGGSANKFSPSAALKLMFEPLEKGRGDPRDSVRVTRQKQAQRVSVADVLKEEGVFTTAELDRLKYLLERGQNLEVASRKGGKAAEDMVEEMGGLTDLLVRLAGARFGTGVASMAGMRSQGLIEAGAGVRFAKGLMGKNTEGLQLSLLERAVIDPEFLVKLLKKGDTPAAQLQNMKFLNAYLIGAGLSLGDEDDVSPGPDVEIETPLMQRPQGLDIYKLPSANPSFDERLDQILNQTSMAPAPPAVPMPAPQTTSASPVSLAQAPSQPDTRRRMAAAFPGDGIMGLMGTG